MGFAVSNIFSLIIIGVLAGSLAGMLLTGKKEGFGRFSNFGLGMAGAVVGDVIVRLFRIDFGLGTIVLSWEELVAAFISCVIIFGIRYYYKNKDTA